MCLGNCMWTFPASRIHFCKTEPIVFREGQSKTTPATCKQRIFVPNVGVKYHGCHGSPSITGWNTLKKIGATVTFKRNVRANLRFSNMAFRDAKQMAKTWQAKNLWRSLGWTYEAFSMQFLSFNQLFRGPRVQSRHATSSGSQSPERTWVSKSSRVLSKPRSSSSFNSAKACGM